MTTETGRTGATVGAPAPPSPPPPPPPHPTGASVPQAPSAGPPPPGIPTPGVVPTEATTPPGNGRARAAKWTILVLVIVAVVGAAAAVVGSSGSDTLTVPSKPPPVLLGQPLNAGALSQNSDWRSLASQISQGSTVSFAGVYGAYPVQNLPTTGTFFLVAGNVKGGNQNIPSLMSQEVSGVRSSFNGQSGARVTVGPRKASVVGGQMQCVSARVSATIVGECLWLNFTAIVQVVTFTDDLATVQRMAAQVVDNLHSGHAS